MHDKASKITTQGFGKLQEWAFPTAQCDADDHLIAAPKSKSGACVPGIQSDIEQRGWANHGLATGCLAKPEAQSKHRHHIPVWDQNLLGRHR